MQSVDATPRQGTRIHLVLAVVAVLMFGFAFALVPLYDTLCRVLGINGKIEQAAPLATGAVDKAAVARDIRVEMVTTNGERLGWNFYPLVGAMTAHPGQMYQLQFYAKNNSGRAMTVRAVPSITPTIGAKYLIKTDCFCFQAQSLEAGESLKMPLTFYVAAELPEEYRTLTLSYALFEVQPE